MASLPEIIHAAGVDARQWPLVLERVRAEFDASVVTIGRHEFASGVDAPLYESPDDPHFSVDLAAFAARNPWYLSSADYVTGRVMGGDDVLRAADLKRTDFYRAFLQPRGLLHRLCGVLAQHGDAAYLLTAYRREARGAFDAADKAGLRSLLGHVALSLESQWRWQESDDLAQALLALSDQDLHPLILVTAQAEVVYRNPAAARLLEQRGGMCLDGVRAVASSAADQRSLSDAIAQVAQAEPRSPTPAAPRVVALAGKAAGLPVVAVVRAAGAVFSSHAGARRGLALISVRGGPAVAHDPGTCALARQYRLTAAQARISALVCAGTPLAAITQTLKVSENTVRSHLQQVFQKTDTHSQMDLVHLHARICVSTP